MDRPPRIEQLLSTYVLERTIRQLATPLVLNLRNLARILVIEDVDAALDHLFFRNAFGDVASLEVHTDWVTGTDDFMVESLNFGKGSL